MKNAIFDNIKETDPRYLNRLYCVPRWKSIYRPEI